MKGWISIARGDGGDGVALGCWWGVHGSVLACCAYVGFLLCVCLCVFIQALPSPLPLRYSSKADARRWNCWHANSPQGQC